MEHVISNYHTVADEWNERIIATMREIMNRMMILVAYIINSDIHQQQFDECINLFLRCSLLQHEDQDQTSIADSYIITSLS